MQILIKLNCSLSDFQIQCDRQQQLTSESLRDEQVTQHILQVGLFPAPWISVKKNPQLRKCLCLVQIQQLEEELGKSREELSQLKSDLQENVELVSFHHKASVGGHRSCV